MSKSSTPIPQPDSGKPIPKIFGVDVNVCTADGKLVYGPDGELLKQRVQMSPGTLADGRPQPLYYPLDCSVNPGRFKGMAEILKERGSQDADKLRAKCRDFNCPPPDLAENDGRRRCCCRRLLYEEEDFANVECKAETLCKANGVDICFLPKFHCKLNPIERCWARANGGRQTDAGTTRSASRRSIQAERAGGRLSSMLGLCRERRRIAGYRACGTSSLSLVLSSPTLSSRPGSPRRWQG